MTLSEGPFTVSLTYSSSNFLHEELTLKRIPRSSDKVANLNSFTELTALRSQFLGYNAFVLIYKTTRNGQIYHEEITFDMDRPTEIYN